MKTKKNKPGRKPFLHPEAQLVTVKLNPDVRAALKARAQGEEGIASVVRRACAAFVGLAVLCLFAGCITEPEATTSKTDTATVVLPKIIDTTFTVAASGFLDKTPIIIQPSGNQPPYVPIITGYDTLAVICDKSTVRDSAGVFTAICDYSGDLSMTFRGALETAGDTSYLDTASDYVWYTTQNIQPEPKPKEKL